MKQYFEEYKQLCDKYKIAYSRAQIKLQDKKETDYDVIVECVGYGYAHAKYRVIRNYPGLSYRDLAIICDRGNLCFGYREQDGCICVYTD